MPRLRNSLQAKGPLKQLQRISYVGSGYPAVIIAYSPSRIQSGVSELVQKVPRQALFFGAAGLLPYLGTSAATVYCARQASLAQCMWDKE